MRGAQEARYRKTTCPRKNEQKPQVFWVTVRPAPTTRRTRRCDAILPWMGMTRFGRAAYRLLLHRPFCEHRRRLGPEPASLR